MIRYLLIFALFYIPPLSLYASEACQIELEDLNIRPDDTEDIMMIIRSNACHFWSWAQKNAYGSLIEQKEHVREFLKYEAFITGDPHHENFSFMFFNGEKSYVLNDLDDSGTGPIFLDFLKFLSVSRSVLSKESRLETSEMLDAYSQGLEQKEWGKEIPALLEQNYNISYKKFLKDYQRKIDEKTSNTEFKNDVGLLKWKKIDAHTRDLFLSLEEQVFKNHLPKDYMILDRAQFTKRLANQDLKSKRYLYYLTNTMGVKHILEFKPIIETSLVAFNDQQLSPTLRSEKALEVFWPYDANSITKIVRPVNSPLSPEFEVPYLLRPKYEKYLKISKSDYEDQPDKIAELSYFISYHLGLIHGKQFIEPQKIADQIKQNKSEFFEYSQKMTKSYLKELRKGLIKK